MLLNKDFDRAFHPQSIAIVGVSNSPPAEVNRGNPSGLSALLNFREVGYKGRIYPVNPKATEILGLKAYPSVSAIPEQVDLVIVAVPAVHVPRVLQDCANAGVLNVTVMTSGFGETREKEGIRLQEEIKEVCLKRGIRLIGPNCLGLQVPSSKMITFKVDNVPIEDPVAFVSQSGGLTVDLMDIANHSLIGFSKLISCGNSVILDPTDFAEYLAGDDETKVVGMYLEGVNDGKRLLEIVVKTNPVKPFIIWKVGLGESSARAALSHSGMLGGERQMWEAFFRQTGAVSVNSLEEMADLMQTFLYMKPPRGKNALVIASGGGNTVTAGELCEQYGIKVPALSPHTGQEMRKVISLVNQGIANPMDIIDTIGKPEIFGQILPILADDPAVDFLLINWSSQLFERQNIAPRFTDCICRFARETRLNKPLAVSMKIPYGKTPSAATIPWIKQLAQAGVPVYWSLARACRALSSFIDYHSRFSPR